MGWVVVAGLTGLAAGVAQWRSLRLLTYHRPEETHLPAPGNRLWVIPMTTLAAAVCVARHGSTRPLLLVILLPLALVGAWLAAVDLDVRRLPDRVVLPLLAWTATALVVLGIGESASTALTAAAGGLGVVGCLWGMYVLNPGGLGFGDVKLAAITGTAAAAVSPGALWWALMGTFTAAAAWAITTRRRDLALGPWLIVGVLFAAGWPPQ